MDRRAVLNYKSIQLRLHPSVILNVAVAAQYGLLKNGVYLEGCLIPVNRFSDFDLDLSKGQEGETLVNELLTGGKTVEVKRDLKWHQTGNVYIEVQCKSRAGDWYASGLSTTKAAYWAFVLQDAVFLVKTDTLIQTVKNKGRRITCDIEPNPSRGYLITIEDLLEETKGNADH